MIAGGVIVYVATRNIMGFSPARWRRVAVLVTADIVVQFLIIVVGLIVALDLDALTATIDLGATPTWEDFVFALTIGTVTFTGLEAASGLAGEVSVGRRGLKRLVEGGSSWVLTFPPSGLAQRSTTEYRSGDEVEVPWRTKTAFPKGEMRIPSAVTETFGW